MRICPLAVPMIAAFAVSACAASAVAPPALVTEGMPALAGRDAACSGPAHKRFTLEAREQAIEVGMGTRFQAWTYNGQLPAPTIEACEGDEVTIELANHAGTAHGLDSHALRTSTAHFGPVAPHEAMTITARVDTPGVYMYHCASGPVTDLHVKSGLAGAMIVYPRRAALPPARELVVVQSAIFGEREATGLIPGTDPARAMKNDPALVLFNGRLEHAPIAVTAGDLVRVYFVNVGPGVSSLHVMGTILDRVIDGGRETRDVQTYGVPAGSGAIVEFRIPENGTFGLVDHDRLAFVPLGLMLDFVAGPAGRGHTMSYR